MRRDPKFLPGDEISNCRILGIHDLHPNERAQDVYKIRYLCCGDKDTMTQAGLGERKRKNTTLCRVCSSEKKKQERGTYYPINLQGVHDLRGHFWPSLNYVEPVK